MGNQLIKNVTVEKEVQSFGGHQGLWSIHNGYKTDNVEQKVSVFSLQKQSYESRKAGREQMEQVAGLLRKQATGLTRFRHPQVLAVVHTLQENNKAFAFATERVHATLAQYLQNDHYSHIYQTQIHFKIHILQLCEAIDFFHNTLKMCCLGISPENIYITEDNKWKLGGLIFSTKYDKNDTNNNNNDNDNSDDKGFNINLSEVQGIKLHPNLNYSSPELLNNQVETSGDIYSLGLVICCILKCEQDQSCYKHQWINVSDHSTHQQLQSQIQQSPFLSTLPNTFQSTLLAMLHPLPHNRPTVQQLLQHPYFNCAPLQTIKQLEQLYQLSNTKQLEFLQALQPALPLYPPAVLLDILLPLLLPHLVNHHLLPQLLKIIIQLIQQPLFNQNKQYFIQHIWQPHLANLHLQKEIPAQALYIIITHIQIFLTLVDKTSVQQSLMVLLVKCLDCGVQKLQLQALRQCYPLFGELEDEYMKQKVVPKVLQLVTNGESEVQFQSLLLLQQITLHLDYKTRKQLLHDLHPLHLQSPCRTSMLALSLSYSIAQEFDISTTTSLVQSLLPVLIDHNITKYQFTQYFSTIQSLIQQLSNQRFKNNDFQQGDQTQDFDFQSIFQEFQKDNDVINSYQGQPSFDFVKAFQQNSQTNQNNYHNNNDFKISDNDFNLGNNSGSINKQTNNYNNQNYNNNFNSNQNNNNLSQNINTNNFNQQKSTTNQSISNQITNQDLDFFNENINKPKTQQNQQPQKNLNLKFQPKNTNHQNSLNNQKKVQLSQPKDKYDVFDLNLNNQNSQQQKQQTNNDDFFQEFNVQTQPQQQQKMKINKNAWEQDDDLI